MQQAHGHQQRINNTLLTQERSIDQDVAGAVCSELRFPPKNISYSAEASPQSLQAGLGGERGLLPPTQTGNGHLVNPMQQFSCRSEDGDVIKPFFRPQVGPLSSELITFRLIIICEAGVRSDIRFESRWPGRATPGRVEECVIIRSVNTACGLSSVTSEGQCVFVCYSVTTVCPDKSFVGSISPPGPASADLHPGLLCFSASGDVDHGVKHVRMSFPQTRVCN